MMKITRNNSVPSGSSARSSRKWIARDNARRDLDFGFRVGVVGESGGWVSAGPYEMWFVLLRLTDQTLFSRGVTDEFGCVLEVQALKGNSSEMDW
jgi:hypothetical protein